MDPVTLLLEQLVRRGPSVSIGVSVVLDVRRVSALMLSVDMAAVMSAIVASSLGGLQAGENCGYTDREKIWMLS